jgi:hypothetical protein
LILGHDWLKQNKANINFYPQCVTFYRSDGSNISKLILDLTELQHPALSLNEITMLPNSERLVDIIVPSMINHSNRVLFQPSDHPKSKAFLSVNAV